MREDNIVQKKSFEFAVRIVNVYKFLIKDKCEFVLSKQVLRSGTSIGANIEEAIGAQSKADFISKLSIAYKEARETRYWLKLLLQTHYLNPKMSDSLISEADELCRIIGSIQISTKQS